MAVGGGAAAAAQQPEAVVQPSEHVVHRQHMEPGRRQLDSQRQPVQLPTDRHHRGRILRAQQETRLHRLCALHEQPHRVRLPQQIQVRFCRRPRHGVGYREHGHGPDRLLRDPQRELAGGQDPQPRAGLQQPGGQGGAGRHDMLAVVQDQQQAPGLQAPDQRIRRRLTRLLVQAQGVQRRRRYHRGVRGRIGRQGRQSDQPRPLLIGVAHHIRHGQG